ncbi:hypothetical protein M758_10G172800 [Ceratodon purpureus]|uniref:Uncharacterized protein n=1 Tax=Ceratodon purpureus TaxID=3225 RepID=A0A8T0GQ29_CERPU|nr:hypothetical protein KC19_10G177300 [Ceratodon purpureus]KAG0604446.1 hypothetical protein M758_10G172800 [Ceratodon purpureus]
MLTDFSCDSHHTWFCFLIFLVRRGLAGILEEELNSGFTTGQCEFVWGSGSYV